MDDRQLLDGRTVPMDEVVEVDEEKQSSPPAVSSETLSTVLDYAFLRLGTQAVLGAVADSLAKTGRPLGTRYAVASKMIHELAELFNDE